MAYSKINWENSPSTNTPINATNLNKMDTQIKDNADDIEGLDTRVTNAESNISNFNLTIYETPTNVTASSGSATSTLQVARNTDGSLAKIYGNIVFSNWTVSGSYIMLTATFQTSLRPTSSFTIKNACMTVIINSSNQQTVNWRDLTINTDGSCTTSGFGVFSDTLTAYLVLPPMLYWIKDFGDEPEEPSL